MPSQLHSIAQPDAAKESLPERYQRIRGTTEALCEPLEVEDYSLQSMDDASPTKWHLAHTSWFFEAMLLKPLLGGYREFHPRYAYLFNSYYESLGERHARPKRGLLSRPTLTEVMAYRRHVDAHMLQLLSQTNAKTEELSLIGLNHEQQHQELLLTDIKHLFANNPLQPRYREPAVEPGEALPLSWLQQPEGIRETGFSKGRDDKAFAYDNESPRHRSWLDAYAIANRPVTNAEYRDFIDDGGYRDARLWLSDAWTLIKNEDWQAPLYWQNRDGQWWHYTLQGARVVNDHEPVAHLSLYEADAYARWAQARLPTETEWEAVAANYAIDGDFAQAHAAHPQALSSTQAGAASAFLYGGVWEWTSSAYGPYPGYQTPAGALGEYNAKFMCSQAVLRGGSCATPQDHMRASYRNFFYPHQQWQFSGLRLAKNS